MSVDINNKPFIKKEHFLQLSEAFKMIGENPSFMKSIMDLKSADEIFGFLQTIHPGDYSEDDVFKYILFWIRKFYLLSDSYAQSVALDYSLKDIKDQTGKDLNLLLNKEEKFRSKNKSSSNISDDTLGISGGLGKQYQKFIAGSLGLFTLGGAVPKANAYNYDNYYDNDYYYTDYVNYGANKKKKKKKENVKKKTEEQNLSWWQRAKNWVKEKWKNPWVKWGTIGVVTFGAACGAYALYRWRRKKSAENAILEERGAKDNKNQAIINLAKEKYTDMYNEALGKIPKNTEPAVASEMIKQKLQPHMDDSVLTDIVSNKGVIHGSVGEKGAKLGEKLLGEAVSARIDGDSKDSKPWYEKFALLSIPISTFSLLSGGLRNIGNWIKDITEGPKNLVNIAKDMGFQVSLDDLFDRASRGEIDVNKIMVSNEIFEQLTSVIKGQDAQMKIVSEILGSFTMKAYMADKHEGELSGLDSTQMCSGIVFLGGSAGTGKSMTMGCLEHILPSYISCIKVPLSSWDGREDINTYLSKQKSFIRACKQARKRFVVFEIEEADKLCNNPEKTKMFATWLHNTYDRATVGTADDEVEFGAVMTLCTTNWLAMEQLFKLSQVHGLNVNIRGKHVTKVTLDNYIDVIRELSKNSSREVPIDFPISTSNRMTFVEFNETTDKAVQEIISMNLTELRDRFEEEGIKFNFNKEFVIKLANLRKCKVFKDGGNRNILKSILTILTSQIAGRLGEVETGKVQSFWLNFDGLDPAGNVQISLKKDKSELNHAEDPEFEDEELDLTRRPEMEQWVQSIMLRELARIVSNLKSVYDSNVVDDWNTILSKEDKVLISNFASLISSQSVPPDIAGQIKFVTDRQNELIDVYARKSISDYEWDLIEGLRDTLKDKVSNALANKRNAKATESSKTNLISAIDSIRLYRKLLKTIGEPDQYSSFVQSNTETINQIYTLFKGLSDYNEEVKSTKKLKTIFDQKEFIKNYGSVMSKKQINSIDKLSKNIQTRFDRLRLQFTERANQIIAMLQYVDSVRNEYPDVELEPYLSVADIEFIDSLLKLIDPSSNIESVNQKFELISKNLDKLQAELVNNGVSNENLNAANLLKSRIDTMKMSIISKNKANETSKILDTSLQDIITIINGMSSNENDFNTMLNSLSEDNKKLLSSLAAESGSSSTDIVENINYIVSNQENVSAALKNYVKDNSSRQRFISLYRRFIKIAKDFNTQHSGQINGVVSKLNDLRKIDFVNVNNPLSYGNKRESNINHNPSKINRTNTNKPSTNNKNTNEIRIPSKNRNIIDQTENNREKLKT